MLRNPFSTLLPQPGRTLNCDTVLWKLRYGIVFPLKFRKAKKIFFMALPYAAPFNNMQTLKFTLINNLLPSEKKVRA